MKEIYAIIRPGKDRETKKALEKVGCLTFTSVRVHGRGKQKGLRYSTTSSDAGPPQFVLMNFLPKKMLYLVVNDRQLKPCLQMILSVNQTGQHGDGKIFVMDLKDVHRIRTGENGEGAIR